MLEVLKGSGAPACSISGAARASWSRASWPTGSSRKSSALEVSSAGPRSSRRSPLKLDRLHRAQRERCACCTALRPCTETPASPASTPRAVVEVVEHLDPAAAPRVRAGALRGGPSGDRGPHDAEREYNVKWPSLPAAASGTRTPVRVDAAGVRTGRTASARASATRARVLPIGDDDRRSVRRRRWRFSRDDVDDSRAVARGPDGPSGCGKSTFARRHSSRPRCCRRTPSAPSCPTTRTTSRDRRCVRRAAPRRGAPSRAGG